jgi:DNA-binding transcriptional ArsR family regulator
MHAFEVLGDPVRRRILELLADHELTSGAVCAVIQREFGISQPGVSAHLRVLREAGVARARVDGTRRLYSINPAGLREADLWLERFRHFWTPRLDALETELARGRRQRRSGPSQPQPEASTSEVLPLRRANRDNRANRENHKNAEEAGG